MHLEVRGQIKGQRPEPEGNSMTKMIRSSQAKLKGKIELQVQWNENVFNDRNGKTGKSVLWPKLAKFNKAGSKKIINHVSLR